MDASSKKQEIDEAIVKFDDEQQEKKDNENIDDEIKKVLDSAQKLIDLLEKIAPDINSDKVVNPKAFLKIIKPLCVSVENSLPILMEFEDNLLYLKDDNAYVLRQKISHIERDTKLNIAKKILEKIFE